MRSLLVCSILGAGLMWAQHSIAAEPKHPAQVQCKHPVKEFLQVLAAGAKTLDVSQVLSAKQYSFVKDEVKKHSADHKAAPGDGAIVIDSDGVFMLVMTKGDGDDAKACGVVPIPVEMVAAIVAIDAPPAATPPPVKKPGEGV